MVTEAGQALERLVEFIGQEGRRKPAEAEIICNNVRIVDIASAFIGESLLKASHQAGIESIDSGMKRSQLGRGIEKAGQVPPVKVSRFQPNQETVQMIVVHEGENLLGQLFCSGEIVRYREAASGFGAILKQRTAGILGHRDINAQIKSFSHRHSFGQVGDGPVRRCHNSLALIRTHHSRWMHSLRCCSGDIPEWGTSWGLEVYTGAEGNRLKKKSSRWNRDATRRMRASPN